MGPPQQIAPPPNLAPGTNMSFLSRSRGGFLLLRRRRRHSLTGATTATKSPLPQHLSYAQLVQEHQWDILHEILVATVSSDNDDDAAAMQAWLHNVVPDDKSTNRTDKNNHNRAPRLQQNHHHQPPPASFLPLHYLLRQAPPRHIVQALIAVLCRDPDRVPEEQVDELGQNALHVACQQFDYRIVRVLLQGRGQVMPACAKDQQHQRLPLHYAVQLATTRTQKSRQTEHVARMIHVLLHAYPHAVMLPDAHGRTPVSMIVDNDAGKNVDARIVNMLQTAAKNVAAVIGKHNKLPKQAMKEVNDHADDQPAVMPLAKLTINTNQHKQRRPGSDSNSGGGGGESRSDPCTATASNSSNDSLELPSATKRIANTNQPKQPAGRDNNHNSGGESRSDPCTATASNSSNDSLELSTSINNGGAQFVVLETEWYVSDDDGVSDVSFWEHHCSPLPPTSSSSSIFRPAPIHCVAAAAADAATGVVETTNLTREGSTPHHHDDDNDDDGRRGPSCASSSSSLSSSSPRITVVVQATQYKDEQAVRDHCFFL